MQKPRKSKDFNKNKIKKRGVDLTLPEIIGRNAEMKRTLSILLVLSMVFSVFVAAGCAADKNASADKTEIVLQIGSPVMTVNGAEQKIDEEGTVPVIVNERTLVPIRAIIEAMGGTVGWDGEKREVSLDYNGDNIRLVIDSTTAYFNGKASELDTAPAIINERTMLPIRFIAESFGFDVAWDGDTQKITITKTAEAAAATPEAATAEPAATEEPAADTAEAASSKTLVVYFSCTNNTKKLAEKVAAAAEGDLVQLVPAQEYTAEDIDYNSDCRANREQNDATARPEIKNVIENFSDYDTVMICHPIWWGTIPRIIYTFMDSYDLSDKDVYMFCTSGSSGISQAMSDVKKYAPEAKVIDGMRGTGSTTEGQLKDWLKGNGYGK